MNQMVDSTDGPPPQQLTYDHVVFPPNGQVPTYGQNENMNLATFETQQLPNFAPGQQPTVLYTPEDQSHMGNVAAVRMGQMPQEVMTPTRGMTMEQGGQMVVVANLNFPMPRPIPGMAPPMELQHDMSQTATAWNQRPPQGNQEQQVALPVGQGRTPQRSSKAFKLLNPHTQEEVRGEEVGQGRTTKRTSKTLRIVNPCTQEEVRGKKGRAPDASPGGNHLDTHGGARGVGGAMGGGGAMCSAGTVSDGGGMGAGGIMGAGGVMGAGGNLVSVGSTVATDAIRAGGGMVSGGSVGSSGGMVTGGSADRSLINALALEAPVLGAAAWHRKGGRAKKADIAALPTQTLTRTEHLGYLSKCMVCLDEFKNGDELKTLPCLHIYHQQCIEHWLGLDNSCPICKAPISPCSSRSSRWLQIAAIAARVRRAEVAARAR